MRARDEGPDINDGIDFHSEDFNHFQSERWRIMDQERSTFWNGSWHVSTSKDLPEGLRMAGTGDWKHPVTIHPKGS